MSKIIQIVAMPGSVANSPRLYVLLDNGHILERMLAFQNWDDITPHYLREQNEMEATNAKETS